MRQIARELSIAASIPSWENYIQVTMSLQEQRRDHDEG